MHIALLTHSTNPRGGVVHTLELARALHDAGHQVTVFAPAQVGQSMFRPVAHALELVPVGPVPRDLHTMVRTRIDAFEQHLRAWPGLQGVDVWHAHDGIGANALANLVAAGRIDGYVRTVHHLDDFDDARVMAWQLRSIEAARLVLCVSPLWVRTLRQDHGIEAELVANGVDLLRFQPVPQAGDVHVAASLGLQGDGPLWLSVGGVEARKNTLAALQAFALHRRSHPHAQWLIVGGASLLDHTGYQAAFRAALAASGVADAVRLAGSLPDDAMPAVFRLADGLLMPSLREGFGLVVLEALASGTPVVVSRQAPFTEYLDPGDAHWADPLQPASIAAAMARALDTRLADVPAVCHRHGWPASAARHVALYRAVRALASQA